MAIPAKPHLPGASAGEITKLIVAVHGIGDQFKYATIQAVARQIAEFCGTPMAFPLGGFHPKEGEVRALQFDVPATYEPVFGGLGFAEVFWADLHQEAQKTEDTIEESKAWAQTMIDRMKAFDRTGNPGDGDRVEDGNSVNYAKTRAVVAEMIETIGVLENLCFLAEKAGMGKFQLRNLLDDYLGAVQLVAEFKDYGGRIFDRFAEMMRKLITAHPGVKDIYIVAHSEGTVVAFHGLLAALSAPGGPNQEWVKMVRAFMTIGSPIDKHIVMWPNLWEEFHERTGENNLPLPWAGQGVRLEKPIKWWNYYDLGDPVGFKLDTARLWLIEHLWVKELPPPKPDGTRVAAGLEEQRFFHFPEEQDVGFTRYYLPGAAHNGYWNDTGVFGHFIRQTMTPDPDKNLCPPGNKRLAQIVSWVCPFLLCFLILCSGTYVLYKNLHPLMTNQSVSLAEVKSPDKIAAASSASAEKSDAQLGREPLKDVAGAMFGIAALLAGITVASRIPRLVRSWEWHLVSLAVFAIGTTLYWFCAPNLVQKHLGDCFLWWPQDGGSPASFAERGALIFVAGLIAVGAAISSKHWPRAGIKPLMILASAATLRIAWVFLHVPEKPNALWPIALSLAAFVYLWWLAALIFDLVFVWHRYIRSNETTRILREIRKKRKNARPFTDPGKIPVSNTRHRP